MTVNLRYRLQIVGLMPERALLRLKRAKIPLYNVRKIDEKTLRFEVNGKDREKVFATYPTVCEDTTAYTPYRVQELGGVGLAKGVEFCKKRVGLLLGGLLFCVLTLAADNLVFGVDVVGATAYSREAVQTLEECGIKSFAFYPKGREDIATAKLLSLSGVEFCSVQKIGHRVRVEIRRSPFQTNTLFSGSMHAKHTGEILSISVLRGSALKQIGDKVTAGEALVGNWFTDKDGGQVRVQPIARVRIACTYECVYEGLDEESAFAESYLSLDLSDKDEIVEKQITATESGVQVRISYLVTETVNF